MLKSLLNLFDKSKVEKDSEKPDDDMMVIGGIMVEAAAIDGKIDKLDVYISMYDNLDLSNTIESKKDTINNDGQKPFQELDLENLDIDKLKLNLTK